MAKESKYQYLIFLDSDSQIKSENFISNYIESVKNPGEMIVYGGTEYIKNKPMDHNFVLHWKYGSNYEALNAEIRSNDPYVTFKSNNFLVDRQVFHKSGFDIQITEYGYEDTLLALKIKSLGVNITHIDNPVYHIGLKENYKFLEDTETAMKNLAQLYNCGKLDNTKLLRFYTKIRKLKLDRIIFGVFYPFVDIMKTNLLSNNPNLILFQLYKLMIFIKANQQLVN